MNILIADPDAESASALESQLSEEGHSATLAGTKAEALELIREGSADIVIIDGDITEKGEEPLVDAIRKWEKKHGVERKDRAYILLAAKSSEEDVLAALLSGADDPRATLAEISRVVEVLEQAIAEADGLDGIHLLTH